MLRKMMFLYLKGGKFERRKALWRFQILNTSNDVNFTRIVALSKEHFKTSISMISLLNTTHQWFKVEDVFMRELELWTDTLHLRVRNKIQESIVEFSKFCLEIQLANNSNPQRQFEEEERDYLSNFGINIVNEVLKRKVIIADRAKGAFVSSISHELRNPLQRSN
ncbi:hypothetical protein GLOIN_2v1884739 [Rhizophagus irregularis DAOM 181602=DAOM 197198]|uniref:Signal transduction histidine kinase dimerisation/phosphoacceptor domain-containing protein n=1 Tax=Rhizophagus irregularis (strain DAOM 181602 / DAOM 197198 / MUCL 43194) TaxID=747089 RepID=A0A2P4P375_RHIID|nr:hypothetical protein GLOIN_2v1884739 [Rhizophagus irregularis DAOM 181602=DAOM 197198]POG59839.1 hypothetical protein GLOIN_2v1884739 [Rhizophagus irregularis DAOM 181602=DAOM 197198]|eukprot:XP_025166705.1 hypothetical protein GLOIN_2v1884739 [Rhizophagus irregularis DAOM 181602=DAOM 197198]